MSSTVQIRNVPSELHRRLKARAAIEGLSMSDYVTAYDAVYVALAEALDTKLLTCDGRLARAPGMARRVELVG